MSSSIPIVTHHVRIKSTPIVTKRVRGKSTPNESPPQVRPESCMVAEREAVNTFTETVESLEPIYDSTARTERSGRLDRSANVLAKSDEEGASPSSLAPEELGPPIPLGSVVRLSGLTATAEYNGRTALFKSWEPALSRALVQLLPPGISAGETFAVKMSNLEFLR